MTYNLTTQQMQELISLENNDQDYLPSSTSLVYVRNKNQIIYHGYQKPKASEDQKIDGQSGSQESKPKKKFVFKMGKDKQAPKANIQPVEKLNIYSIDENRWSQLQIKGKIPLPREKQQLLMLNENILLMYGGKNLQNQKLLNDLHALNLQTLQWKKLFSIQGPPATGNNIFIKLTQTKIVLINFRQMWTFESRQVKWELNTNELPGGVWENLDLKFDNLIEIEKEILLSAVNITNDMSFQRLLVFTCNKEKGHVRSYLVNLTDKEISKLKMDDDIYILGQNMRYQFGSFNIGMDSIQGSSNQAILTIKTNNQLQIYLVEYDDESYTLKILSKSTDLKISQFQLSQKLMGKCFDLDSRFYCIFSDTQNLKKKFLKKLQIQISRNVSQVVSEKKITSQHSGYMKNMKSSQIHSIPQESNESSVVGMRSYPNEREEEFEQIENENFRYQMRRNEKNKFVGSGPISEVNRSSSALSGEIESDVEETDKNESNLRRNQHSMEERSSFYNDSNLYAPSQKSPQQNDIANNNSSFPEEQHLQKTLEKILVYEHIKRQKLQQKSRFLQKAIQKSEPLAKILTKYASTSQKNRHIENVKACKQELETVWGKQVFFRKQIHQHFVASDSEMLSSKNNLLEGGKSRSKQLVYGKIDMKKLMRKHLVIQDDE